jgi:electron transport complex protein RnfG
MKKMKEYIVPTITLFVICLVATALLGITNAVTAPTIDKLAKQKEIDTRKEVFAQAVDFGEKVSDEFNMVPALDQNNNVIGYVVVTSAKGYGGNVEVMTGVTVDGKVTGISILSHSETPGLGAKAKTDDGWRAQFVDKIMDITVSKDQAGDNSIDAITGATITSKAVVAAVNEAIALATGGENVG